MKKLNLKIVLFLSSLFLLFSCERAQKTEFAKVSLHIDPVVINQTEKKFSSRKLNPNGTINPSTMAEINCYAVLVSGPEESLRRNQCSMSVSGNIFSVGFFAGGFSSTAAGTNITLEIPSGKDRVIRLVGFQVDASGSSYSSSEVCAQFKKNELLQNYISDPFIVSELGQLVLNAGATQDVTMTTAFSLNQKIGDCSGPDFNQDNKNGPPTKIAVSMQDAVGLASSPLRDTSCVGLKIQLQDSVGRPAYVTGSPTVNVKIKEYISPFSIGDFFATSALSGDFCNVANKINPVSGDISVTFSNAGVNYSDLSLFFKPYANPSATRQIQITDAASVLTPVTLNFAYDSSSSTPAVKYGVYDVFTNRSTFSANMASKRILVKRNECRSSALQMLNSVGVSQMLSSTTGTPSILVSHSASPGEITFYSSHSDCLNNTTPSNIFTLNMSNFADHYAIPFAYKVQSASLTNFSLTVTNSSGLNAFLPSGDLTAAENFFGVSN